MKTSDDFVGHAPRQREIPDYDSDPFRLVVNAEEKLVDLYQFNLQGNPVMTTTTIRQAMEEAGVVHTRHAYFDLVEYLDTKLDTVNSHDQFRANVTSSLAWYCDTMAINLARAMFFRDYKEAEHDSTQSAQEAYNAFIENFLGTIDFNESGSEFNDGIARDLTQMLGFRERLHDLAESSASRIGRDYQPRSFRELLASEKPQPPSVETRAKLAQIAKFVIDDEQGSKEELEKAEKDTLEVLLARAEGQALRNHENRKRIAPVIEGLLDVAQRYKKDVPFTGLDKQVQERLIDQAAKAAQRTTEQLATYNTISAIEFAMIMRLMREMKKELNDVLKTFRTPEEDATIRAQQRAAKAKLAEAKNPEAKQQAQEELEALQRAPIEPTPAEEHQVKNDPLTGKREHELN